MKKKRMIACTAAVLLAMSISGCAGTGGSYLKDIKSGKYVTLGAYTGLEIDVGEAVVDPAAVETYVSTRMQSLPAMTVTGRTAQLGDTANIDYRGRLADNGVYFDKGSAEGYDLVLGSGRFIPGFEDGVVGMSIGSKKELALTFPENYQTADLAGRDVIFEVTLNSIAAVTDESVAMLGIEGVSTIDEMEAYLRGAYAEQIETEHRAAIESALCEQIESSSVFETAPEEFRNRMKSFYNSQIEYAADLYGQAYGVPLTASELLSYIMSNDGFTGTEEEYTDKMAVERANTYLMIDAIAEEQGISVSDEELMTHIEEDLADLGYASVEEYKEKEDIEDLREQVLYDKVMDYLIENNTVR